MKAAELAAAYLTHYRTKAESDFWAVDAVWKLCEDKFEEGLAVTFALIEMANTDAELAYVAAGPVEDMLMKHGMKAFSRFEDASRQSVKARRALAGVWIDDSKEVYPSWEALMLKYGIMKPIQKARHRKRQT